MGCRRYLAYEQTLLIIFGAIMPVITVKPRKYDKNLKRNNNNSDLATIAEHLHSEKDVFALKDGKQYSVKRFYVVLIKLIYLPIISVLLAALLAYMQLSPKEWQFAWIMALIYTALILPIKHFFAFCAPLLTHADSEILQEKTIEEPLEDKNTSKQTARKNLTVLTADRNLARWTIYVIANTALCAFLWHISVPLSEKDDMLTWVLLNPSYSFHAVSIFILQYPLMVKYSRLWECAIVYAIIAIMGTLIVTYISAFPFGHLLAFMLLQTLIVPVILPLMIAFNLLWAQWLLIKRR
jgi:hypothetical protein